MTDWLSSMQQTYEYYIVDPNTWKDKTKINTVVACSITREYDSDTLGSATFEIDENLGEVYIRVYLVTIQNGIERRYPLGTYLVQTPSRSFNGMSDSYSLDAYTPLLELKEKLPPVGYTIPKGKNVMAYVCDLASDNMRAPVVKTTKDDIIQYDFVANTSDTWASYLGDLVKSIGYRMNLDEVGRLIFEPDQRPEVLQPVWEFDDSNSSILLPSITVENDIYGIPNVVEVIYSNGPDTFRSVVKNTNPNSPLSIQNRGREIMYRDTSPNIVGLVTQKQLDRYADKLLSDLSSVECSITYSHGYCPVRVGDCVRLNYKRAGVTDIRAKVISQSISCVPGCTVSEKAIFTTNFWR